MGANLRVKMEKKLRKMGRWRDERERWKLDVGWKYLEAIEIRDWSSSSHGHMKLGLFPLVNL